MLWLAKQTLGGHSDEAIERIANGILGADSLRKIAISSSGKDDEELERI